MPIARRPSVLWRRIDDEVIVLPATGDVIELAGAAAAVWELLDEPATPSDIASAFAAVDDRALTDLLERLRSLELIEDVG